MMLGAEVKIGNAEVVKQGDLYEVISTYENSVDKVVKVVRGGVSFEAGDS